MRQGLGRFAVVLVALMAGLVNPSARAVAAGPAPTGAPAANTRTAAFASSFESADPQPMPSTSDGEPVNVTGSIPPGSLSAYVTKVTASKENPTGEVATNLLDANPRTKWLAFASSAWIVYQLSGPKVMTSYHLTSANDFPGRDPKSFSVEGSMDGSTWKTIDTRTNQSFPNRLTGYDFATNNTTAYGFYRLSIAANSDSGGVTQLADWDLRDARPASVGMLAEVGTGPANGPTSKPSVGFTGTKALRFGGKHTGSGPASASDLLFDNVGAPLTQDSELSYQIFPDFSGDLQYPSTWVGVDLVLDDGKTLSTTAGLADANGFGVAARAHGQQKLLFANQWNAVHIPLSVLAGRKVTKVLLTYDNPGGSGGAVFSGWLDDVRIGPAAAPIDGSSLVNYVDTRRGTMSTSSYSRGSNIPAAAVPNGFNFFTPMTDAGQQGTLYQYQRSNNAANLPTLQAIGISHEPSIWMGDRDQLAIMPSASATPSGELAARGLPFNHSDEIARPDLYSVKFTNDLVTEVTPTDHGGIYRFTFPGTTGSVVVDQVAGGSSLSVAADGTVSGWVDGGSGASAGRSRMFVYGAFDTKPTTVGQAGGSRGSARYAGFSTAAGSSVLLRLATSFISLDQAHQNLDLEVSGKSFEAVHAAAVAGWNSRLGVISVEGASQNQRVTLYSNLYRMNLYPNSQFENTGTAATPRYQYASPVAPRTGNATDTTTNAKIVDGKIYVNNGFWDSYRTVWPL